MYTDQLGGHGALPRQHANRSISEEQRRRFVEAFLEAADEVGLPNDERLRHAFTEYLEWGSRIAQAVSRPGADLRTDQPVPRWSW